MEVLKLFIEIISQRAPRWAHVENDCNIIAVSTIISTYDRIGQCRELLRGGTYLRAVPRDCAWMIFKSLRTTRWESKMIMRQFLGKPQHIPRYEAGGIPGRDTCEYAEDIRLDGRVTVFCDHDMVFNGVPDQYATLMLCGYYHSNGVELQGCADATFSDLMAGAVAIAGPVLKPTRIQLRGSTYVLEYWCRGYKLAVTNINSRYVHTMQGGFIRHGRYQPDTMSPIFKRLIFTRPLP